MDRLYHVDPRLLASAGVLALPRGPSAGIILAGFKTAADGRGLPRGPSTANVRPQECWHYHVHPSVVGRRVVCTLRHRHSHHVQIGHILEHWRGIHRRKLTRHCMVDNTVIPCIKHNTHRLKVLDSLLITFKRRRRMSKTPESLRTTMAKLLPCRHRQPQYLCKIKESSMSDKATKQKTIYQTPDIFSLLEINAKEARYFRGWFFNRRK